MKPVRLLITDLDNTLYDWVTYFASAFRAMTDELVPLLDVDPETLLSEFKALHQYYGNSEQPFAVLELPSVQRRFGALSPPEMLLALDPALHAFNRTRKQLLHLYETVADTLHELRRRSVVVVGHTEAIAINAYYRLSRLDIVDCFQRLYALDGHVIPHPDPRREAALSPPEGLVQIVPKSERKPNPLLLQDICSREGFRPSEALYVGDSLTRDISMAKAAGVTAVWAQYGTEYDHRLWRVLVRVTHWTDEDVQREEELKKECRGIEPDHTIKSFGDLLSLEGLDWGDDAAASSAVRPSDRGGRSRTFGVQQTATRREVKRG
jgi:FMN phosphatase YigB (HAD superfamily)